VNSFDRIFALSPNIRLEPDETIETGCHLSEFRQLDLEVARASYFDVMEIGGGDGHVRGEEGEGELLRRARCPR